MDAGVLGDCVCSGVGASVLDYMRVFCVSASVF